ncbi:MAG: hypothetical protein ACN2B6_02230 [Rickettsiales bacterium]
MKHIPLKKWLLGIFAAFMLTSCSSEHPVDFPPLSFARYQPIYLNVSRIEFVDEYKSPLTSPYVEHLMPYSPAEAMRIWAKERLRAIGPDKVLQIIIKDGSVVATELHKDSSIADFFTIDQDRRYDAKLDVELRIYGHESALSEANVHVKAARSVTLSENASAWRRSAAQRAMIGEMMEGVNAELEKNMFLYMGRHINFSQNP